jgi:uncharacterized C2H2 Zn-finger protein
MITCPLCGYVFDETALACQAGCPLASVQGCNLLCCPNCGYQMVDERKSALVRLLRRAWSAAAKRAAPRAEETPR